MIAGSMKSWASRLGSLSIIITCLHTWNPHVHVFMIDSLMLCANECNHGPCIQWKFIRQTIFVRKTLRRKSQTGMSFWKCLQHRPKLGKCSGESECTMSSNGAAMEKQTLLCNESQMDELNWCRCAEECHRALDHNVEEILWAWCWGGTVSVGWPWD